MPGGNGLQSRAIKQDGNYKYDSSMRNAYQLDMPQASLFGTNSKLIQQLKVLDKPEPGNHITAISEGSSVENTPVT